MRVSSSAASLTSCQVDPRFAWPPLSQHSVSQSPGEVHLLVNVAAGPPRLPPPRSQPLHLISLLLATAGLALPRVASVLKVVVSSWWPSLWWWNLSHVEVPRIRRPCWPSPGLVYGFQGMSSHCPLVMDSLSRECAPLISRPLGLLLTVQFWLLYTSMDRTCWLHTPAFYMLNFNFCVATNISSYYCMMISTSMSPSIGVKMHQVFLNSPNNSK